MTRFIWMAGMLAVCLLAIGCSSNGATRNGGGGTPGDDGSGGGATPAVKVINGVSGNKWDPQETVVKTGDTVHWVSKSGFHGVTFTKWSVAKDILEVTGGEPMSSSNLHPDAGPDAHGTKGAGAGTLLVEARIGEIPDGVTEIPFICSIHGSNMPGKLVVDSGQ